LATLTNQNSDYSVLAEGASIVNVSLSIADNQTLAIVQSLTMLRQQMIRSLRRPAHRAALNGSRAFTVSARRPAEVDLTIGTCHSIAGGDAC
jgi:hypothetical protein